MACLGKRLRPVIFGVELIITDHFVDGKRIGITLPRPAQKTIEVGEQILTEYDTEVFCIKDYHITFNTLDGEVEYMLAKILVDKHRYRCVLVEDRRNVG